MAKNYQELQLLNPNFPLLIRTVDNAMPAVTTELDFTKQDLLKFMIQTGRFRDANGTIAENRVEAAKDYLKFDFNQMQKERWAVAGVDPEQPGKWTDAPLPAGLESYQTMKDHLKKLESVIQSGPNDEYTRAENALLMCQRVDLWCAGEDEVERAVVHLSKLGQALNQDRQVDFPAFLAEYKPGSHEIYT